jgi:hypothetical protein
MRSDVSENAEKRNPLRLRSGLRLTRLRGNGVMIGYELRGPRRSHQLWPTSPAPRGSSPQPSCTSAQARGHAALRQDVGSYQCEN